MLQVGQKMIVVLCVLIFSVSQSVAKYNRTVIQERDMYMKEAMLWRQTTHAFIRACGKSGSFGADARKCPAGIVIKEPFKPGCICVRGIWVVHFELCGSSPVIIMGGHKSSYDCYYIDHEVRSILFIGNPDDPFQTKAYISPMSMHVFHELSLDGSWSPLIDFRDPVLLVIRKGSQSAGGTDVPLFEDEEDQFCFKFRQEANKEFNNVDGVVIWTTALLPTRYRRVFGNCTDPDNIGYDAYINHKEFYYYGFRGTPNVGLGCFEPCSIWPEGKPLLRNSQEFGGNLQTKTFQEWMDFIEERHKDPAGVSQMRKRITRRKRRVTNCEMVWDGRAYCMRSFWDAVDKFELTDKQKVRCFPEVGKNLRGSTKLSRYGRRKRRSILHIYQDGHP